MPEKPSLLDRLLGPSVDDAGEELAEGLRRPGARKRAAVIGFTAFLVFAIVILAINPSLVFQVANVPDLSSIISDSDREGSEPTQAGPSPPPPPTLTVPPPTVSQVAGTTLDAQGGGSSEAPAQIMSPADGDSVPELSRFEGTYSNIPIDGCLWLFIDSPWNSLLFPQGPVWKREDGTFDRNVAIGAGNDDDHLKEFVVNIGWVPQTICDLWSAIGQPVGTPSGGSEAASEPQLSLPPIKELPPGVVLYSAVTVTLDRNLESFAPSAEDSSEIK